MAESVSTSMDQLVGLLADKGVVKITDAARDLGTDKSHIESWAKMLEKEGAVQIHYSVIGGAMIKKGPKFNLIMKGSVKPAAAAERYKAAEAPKVEIKPRQPMPEPKDTSEEYRLIRKRIEDEEKTLEGELQRLASEQTAVVQSMTTLIAEGRRLKEYIENLRQVVERINEKRAGRLDSIAKNKV